MSNYDEVNRLLSELTEQEQREIFSELRKKFPIHSLETRFNTTAEQFLDAIERSGDLTIRGFRGILADSAFYHRIAFPLKSKGWSIADVIGDSPIDSHLKSPDGVAGTVQVKLQRSETQEPMRTGSKSKTIIGSGTNMWVVETQRTRSGTSKKGATRPYRFGDFDILAVSLHPSTGSWSDFRYTVANWLIPNPKDESLIYTYQPVAMVENDDWTDDFEVAFEWYASRRQKRIRRAES